MSLRRILVTGALGQIGVELTTALRARYGSDRVLAADIKARSIGEVIDGDCMPLDCTKPHEVREVFRRHDIGVVYHLAALLSAVAEENPTIAWRVNVDGLVNMLEAARENRCKLFFPSSIGAFGPSTPRDRTPQTTIQRPTTIYGVAKVSGELLCDYYASKYGVDARGLRLPGLISHVTAPGGGTTDYAVHIFHQALEVGRYACFLDAATRLPMMYMPDAVEAMIAIMNADPARLRFRNAYNVSSMSFTPAELAAEIRKHIPSFEIDYRVDALRQSIAESWPRSLDDSEARTDWDFSPRFDLPTMTTDMLTELSRKLMQTVSGNP